tara:strand:- start:340 stop:561 length:222 start_codon:yes stop_codon:yes gene_type:complete
MQYVFFAQISQFDIPKIEQILSQNKIEFLIKTPYESSLAAGWITPGSTFNQHSLFINSIKFNEAKSLLNLGAS